MCQHAFFPSEYRTKNGTSIKDVAVLKDPVHGSRYEIKGNQLIMKRLDIEDAGTYTCHADGETADINVVGEYLI